jgi:hypothetical protein
LPLRILPLRLLGILALLLLRILALLLLRVLALLLRILILGLTLRLRILILGLLRISLRRGHGALVRLDAGLLLRLRLRLAGVVRRRWRSGGVLRCLGLLRTANLEVVVDLGDASHLAGQGGGELFGGLRGNGAGECDLALDGGCGDEIVLEGLRSIEGVHDVHFDLSVSALAGWGGCVLRERHNGAEGNNRRPGHDLDETSLEHCRIHLDISSIPAYLPRL